MKDAEARKSQLIPVAEIRVANPRTRNKALHREIAENIATIGLKRPITVRRQSISGEGGYDLVCGQGRLEAFQLLDQSHIPAIVIDASEVDGLVMSLVENIARRSPRPLELMQQIGDLHRRGYSEFEISKKIGISPSYAATIVNLLDRGEERLLAAIETGLIPFSFALDVARASTAEAQNLLLDAYTTGKIKGRKLAAVRKLLERRLRRSKAVEEPIIGRKTPQRKLTSAELMRVYQREADKQQLLVRKSDFTQAKLLFVVEAIKDLLADDSFTTLLRAEDLETMPRALVARISGESAFD